MKKIGYVVIVTLLFLIIIGCGTKSNKLNLKKEIRFGDLVLKNTNITSKENLSIMTTTLTNTTSDVRKLGWINLKIKYKNDKNIEEANVLLYFGSEIQGNQVLQTVTTLDFNLDNVVDIEYSIKEER